MNAISGDETRGTFADGAGAVAVSSTHDRSVARGAVRVLGMLAVQYVLGMAENLIGLPSETEGTARTASGIVLVAHVLVAIGLVIAAARVAWMSRSSSSAVRRLALAGLAVVVVTFVTGGITASDTSATSAWSFAMAVGFIVSAALYVALLVPGRAGLPEAGE